MHLVTTVCFQLDGFDRYKYSCRDTSPLSNYVMHPFWNKAVLLCPTWVAPNLLTLVGFLCCVLHYLLPTFYDYDFTASTSGSDHPIPSWMWALVSLLLFASHTLDGIDGKQARRTGTSSPLGELFDHGCDAWAAVFITSTFYSTFGRNDDNLSIPVMRMFCVLWNVFLCFHIRYLDLETIGSITNSNYSLFAVTGRSTTRALCICPGATTSPWLGARCSTP